MLLLSCTVAPSGLRKHKGDSMRTYAFVLALLLAALVEESASAQQYKNAFGPDKPEATYVKHAFKESTFDTGEILLNFAEAGSAGSPALLLIPGQTESWWGYEKAMTRLQDHFHVFAVDLRGQGRSSRTPGRYTLDNIGNDLVRFMTLHIKQPVMVSGLSSGGLVSAWLSAYAPPGVVRAALYEDPPFFSSAVRPAVGPSISKSIVGPVFERFSKFLGDQWSIGDWDGMRGGAAALSGGSGNGPPQNLKEYDPEWAKAFVTGTFLAGCEHGQMLSKVKVPVLYTHHRRTVNPQSGVLMGACSEEQAQRVKELVSGAGHGFEYRSFPSMGHNMHEEDPEGFAKILIEWESKLNK